MQLRKRLLAVKADWKVLEREIEAHNKRHPKKIPYPKGSIEEAINEALNILGGSNENGLGERRRK
jgi:hypothetical protein